MTLMCQGPHNSIEFFAIDAIVTHKAIKFLTEIGNGLLKLD